MFLIPEAVFFFSEAEGILLTRGHNKGRRHRATESGVQPDGAATTASEHST